MSNKKYPVVQASRAATYWWLFMYQFFYARPLSFNVPQKWRSLQMAAQATLI